MRECVSARAKGEYLFRAEQALLRLNIAALLQRRLQVHQLTVQNADLALEAAADSRRNWSFSGQSGSGRDLLIDALKVAKSRLSYRSPVGVDYRGAISEIRFEGRDVKQLALEANFTYQGVPVSVAASAEPQVLSRAGERPFKGQVQMPDATLSVTGNITDTVGLANLEVALQSERLDLQKSVAPLWSSMSLGGTLQQVAGRFKTAGDTPQSLASNLSSELRIAAANLRRSAGKGRRG